MEASPASKALASKSEKSILSKTFDLTRRDFDSFLIEAEKKGWVLDNESARSGRLLLFKVKWKILQ